MGIPAATNTFGWNCVVNDGDAEELIKRQRDEVFEFDVARGLTFQIAFGIFAAAEKFSVKHYERAGFAVRLGLAYLRCQNAVERPIYSQTR